MPASVRIEARPTGIERRGAHHLRHLTHRPTNHRSLRKGGFRSGGGASSRSITVFPRVKAPSRSRRPRSSPRRLPSRWRSSPWSIGLSRTSMPTFVRSWRWLRGCEPAPSVLNGDVPAADIDRPVSLWRGDSAREGPVRSRGCPVTVGHCSPFRGVGVPRLPLHRRRQTVHCLGERFGLMTSRLGPNGWSRAAPQRKESEVVRLTWGAPLRTSALRLRPGGGRCSSRLLRGRRPESICTRRGSTSWQAIASKWLTWLRAELTCSSLWTLLARPGRAVLSRVYGPRPACP